MSEICVQLGVKLNDCVHVCGTKFYMSKYHRVTTWERTSVIGCFCFNLTKLLDVVFSHVTLSRGFPSTSKDLGKKYATYEVALRQHVKRTIHKSKKWRFPNVMFRKVAICFAVNFANIFFFFIMETLADFLSCFVSTVRM